MSKSTFIIGMLAAVTAHAALLWPFEKPNPASEQIRPQVKRPAVAVLSQTLEVNRPVPKPAEPVPLKQVVEVPVETKAADGPGDTSAEGLEDAMPPLRVVWQSADQLRSVAAHLGMRIVAVNTNNQVTGEIATSGPVRVVSFEGRLSAYSNRVRTLPRCFFGSSPVAGSDVGSFWVLVPADLDARFILLQRDAIRREGLTPAEVRAMDAEFRTDRGGCELVITRLVRE